jgi:hypothetical protein
MQMDFLLQPDFIDADVANDPYSAANTTVPAEFARRLAVG